LADFTIISKSQADVKQNRLTSAKKGYVKNLTLLRIRSPHKLVSFTLFLDSSIHMQSIYRIAKSTSGILLAYYDLNGAIENADTEPATATSYVDPFEFHKNLLALVKAHETQQKLLQHVHIAGCEIQPNQISAKRSYDQAFKQ